MAVINDPATELHNVYGRTRLASFRGQGTVADILALSSQEFLAGGLQITQKELYPALSGGLAVHAHRIITKAQFLDDSTASISYSIMVKPRGASIIPGVMELRMSKRGKRWYAVPTDELVSPLRIVDYLTGGVRGS